MTKDFVLIGLGANLDHPRFGPPRETLEAALACLAERGVEVLTRSPWYRSRPIPASDQPWFVNGVVRVETPLGPSDLLDVLHAIEAEFGRERGEVNAPRVLDLDLLAYGRRKAAAGERPELPHPRMAGRAFVLLPLRDLAPEWRHPVTGEGLEALIAALPADQVAEPM